MDKIDLTDVLPKVFAAQSNIQSDIWHQKVSLEKGNIYLIEAKSGTGKSSLCSYISGYRRDFEGKICFDGQDISRLKVSDWVEIRKRNISLLFQELRLFPELTAYENVAIKNDLTGWKQKKDILDWFDRLGIADQLNKKVGQMSFGQQQRVALMRALSQPFDFLLADEPVSHLDDENSRIMGAVMLEEAGRQGAGLIVTSIGKHIDLNYSKIFRL